MTISPTVLLTIENCSLVKDSTMKCLSMHFVHLVLIKPCGTYIQTLWVRLEEGCMCFLTINDTINVLPHALWRYNVSILVNDVLFKIIYFFYKNNLFNTLLSQQQINRQCVIAKFHGLWSKQNYFIHSCIINGGSSSNNAMKLYHKWSTMYMFCSYFTFFSYIISGY